MLEQQVQSHTVSKWQSSGSNASTLPPVQEVPVTNYTLNNLQTIRKSEWPGKSVHGADSQEFKLLLYDGKNIR